MTILTNYSSFTGKHWETGTVHNALDFQGSKAPHTGKAHSEAFLLGVSGGVTVGYFQFHYEGSLPQFVLLTRNTFDPLQTMLGRLGIAQNTLQTTNPAKAKENLVSILEEGQAAITWADSMMMPYNVFSVSHSYWAMQPLLVFGLDEQFAYIADRSSQPLHVDQKLFGNARARVKKMKNRVISLGHPKEEKLISAASSGIWQCIQLFTEAPPRGTQNNFGLTALGHWQNMLTNTRNKKSWSQYFPASEGLLSALIGNGPFPRLYEWIDAWGDGGAERFRYAEFLNEAAVLLGKPARSEASEEFKESGKAWNNFATSTLPETIAPLAQAKSLLDQRLLLFREKGSEAEEEIRAINQNLKDIVSETSTDSQLTETVAIELRAKMAHSLESIRSIESQAIHSLQSAMA